jgi:hypothetical protein
MVKPPWSIAFLKYVAARCDDGLDARLDGGVYNSFKGYP